MICFHLFTISNTYTDTKNRNSWRCSDSLAVCLSYYQRLLPTASGRPKGLGQISQLLLFLIWDFRIKSLLLDSLTDCKTQQQRAMAVMFYHFVLGTVIFRIRARRPGREAMPLTLTSFSKICLQTLKHTLLPNAFTKLSDEFNQINFKSLSNFYQCNFASRKPLMSSFPGPWLYKHSSILFILSTFLKPIDLNPVQWIINMYLK